VVSVVSPQKNLADLSSDEKIGRLTEVIERWFPVNDLGQLLEQDLAVAKLAEQATLATTKFEYDHVNVDLMHARREHYKAYTHAAEQLRRSIEGPQYAEEIGILKTLASGKSCQVSVLREVLHGLVKAHAVDQDDSTISINEGALV
jgi:hypothetical protein